MKNKGLYQISQKGFSVIEAVVGIIIGLIILLAFTTLISESIRYGSINEKQLKAELYLQELVEVAKDLEQSPAGWDRLTTTTSPCYSFCYPEISGTSWRLFSGTSTIDDIYTRWLTIENVCRSTTTNEILPPPCDPAGPTYSSTTKKVIAQIEWREAPGKTATATLEAYLYNFNP